MTGGAAIRALGLKRVSDRWLKERGLDAHEVKQDAVGRGGQLSRYDIYRARSGRLYAMLKGGKGEPQFTGYRDTNVRGGEIISGGGDSYEVSNQELLQEELFGESFDDVGGEEI